MPDFRQSGDKPQRPQDHLGLDVKIDQEDIENDAWMQTVLKDVAKNCPPSPQHIYMGSIAVHMWRTPERVVLTPGMEGGERLHDVANVIQIAVGDTNEYIANMTLANVMVRLKQHFGRKHSTRDLNDGRTKGNPSL